MSKVSDAEFKAYLKEIREFIESDEIEEMQRECEVTNVFPQRSSICKLFSIDTTRLVGDEMLEIFGGVGLRTGAQPPVP